MIASDVKFRRVAHRAGLIETAAGAVPVVYGAAAAAYVGSRLIPNIADRVTPFVGLNPKKSFFTPWDLIPFVGPAGKIGKGLKAGKKGIGTVALGAGQMLSDAVFFGYLAMDIFGGPNKPRTMINTVNPGSGLMLPKNGRKAPRNGKIGRRRKRCTHKDSRGRRCLRPAGHSGRHRYS